ncbi:hypothetical protein BN1723_002432 [Verticillium longisporum]|uniref:FAD-binding domain-containing protein n=1 Tax=Verticillium longisporum TaxID=100787 RepID=A0A0G4L5R3_VERLO|nr:hypothetical protein BN1723_002432 [Verticillium longisporum]
MASKSQSGFRVLVAGGGIAGLTLANCLERAGVEYILLEAHDNVAPRVGASIGLLPNGSRILDQLGCYDKILEETQGVRITRFNYAISYLERETVLRVLYENLQDKSPIQLSRRIMNVDHSGTDGVVAHCQDGTIVAGDVLVGCDGVNSLVRREMWRLSEHGKPQATPVSVRHDLKADFQCLFGLSTRTRGVNAGEMDVNFASGFSTMVIGGKDGRVFWFVFAKMDKTYTSPNIPKYSYQDAVEFANEYMDFTIKDGLKFSDLWQSRTSVTLAATEEAELKEWTWGRIACVGDNVHKMTPHMGAGGNAAMESAATLANELRKLGQAAEKTKIDLETVQMHLETYQRGRRHRTSAVCEAPIAFFYCLQSFKIVHVMGVYCFAHYVQSPIENFRAKDMRLTNRAYSGTVLVTLLVAYYVPLVTAIMPVFSITTRLTWGYVFQYFPFSISILQNGLKHLFLEDVMDEDKIWAPNGDLSLIGLTIFTFALFAFAARLLALIDTLTSQVLSQSSDMVLMTELGGWAQPIRANQADAIFGLDHRRSCGRDQCFHAPHLWGQHDMDKRTAQGCYPQPCRSPLRIAKSYAVDALTATYLMRMAPSLLRPIAYWLIPQCRTSRQAVQSARKLIDPEVKKRKMLVDDALQSGAKPSKISDAIGWMYQVAAGRPVDFVCAQMQLTLAAVHTTTEVLAQAILDLCERPEPVQKLRDEVIEVLGDEGWEKTSFYKLKLMDSFFKESQRFTPLVSTAMSRLVEQDITLSDGRFLPKGVRINVLTDFRNAEKYPNPDEFNATRFVPMRQGQGSENASQLASTSSEHTLFGHGRHACPGRFFAVNEMKIILAQFLLEYDLRAEEGLTKLQPQAFETSIGVNPAVAIEIRRRIKSADVRIEKRE